MRTTPLLAALLMLGGVSYAYAQEGPPEGSRGASERGSSAAQERGSGSDAGASNRSSQGDEGPGASGKENSGSSKGRSAEKSDKPDSKASDRAAGDESSGKKSSKSAKSDTDKSTGSKGTSREGSDTTDKSAASKESAPDNTNRDAADTSKSSPTDRSAEGKTSTDSAKQVDLSGDKRTQVQTAFRDAGNVKHRTNVDIDISVGRRLPRDWDFVPVPTAVISIVPEYRGYYFAYVGDEYVIVEPDTYEVVYVLPAERSQASSSSGSSGGGQCSAQLSLSSKERDLVIDNIKGGREARVSDISVGSEVPRGVELLRFPSSVIAEAKALEGCQYFDAGDQIAIVDPGAERIVAVIEKKS